MKRIFIGIKIETDKDFLKLASAIKDELSGEYIKWTDPSNIHVTLAFLGDTPEEKIKLTDSMLRDKCSGSGRFEIVLRAFGVFKNLRDAKIIWAGLDQSEKLNALQASIIEGLKMAEITVDDKPFSPHLTIGRIKHISDKDKLKVLLLKYHSTEIQRVPVSEVTLFESILRQEGPQYNTLATYQL